MIDNYWSTELGSPITSLALGAGKPAKPKPGAAGFALPGMDVRVVNDEGQELEKGRQGNIVIKTPLSGTGFRTCWKDEAGFQRVRLALSTLRSMLTCRAILIGFEGKVDGLILVTVISLIDSTNLSRDDRSGRICPYYVEIR